MYITAIQCCHLVCDTLKAKVTAPESTKLICQNPPKGYQWLWVHCLKDAFYSLHRQTACIAL